MAYSSPTIQNSTVEYNNSSNLQNSTIDYSPSLQPSSASSHDGSNYPINPPQDVNNFTTDQPVQYIVNDPNNPVVYADPNAPVVYTIADNSKPALGAPVMTFNNPPITLASVPPPPPPAQGFHMSKEIIIAICAIIIIIVGGIMLGVSKSTFNSCFDDCPAYYSYYSDYYYTSSACYKKCKSSYNALRGTGIAFLAIGAVALLGDGAFKYTQIQHEQQMQQQQQMQQMQQMQMQA